MKGVEATIRNQLKGDRQLSKEVLESIKKDVEDYVAEIGKRLDAELDNFNQLSKIQGLRERKRIDLNLYLSLSSEGLCSSESIRNRIRGNDQKIGNNSDINKAGVYQ
jgi:hypothetical protein